MPPKKGIVKSGNAGNSTKSTKPSPDIAHNVDKEKPLFPPGFKYPLSLLNERYDIDNYRGLEAIPVSTLITARCQANGWDKPSVDTVS